MNEIRGLQSVPTRVVIAISSALYRKGLSSLFSSEIFSVYEVETEMELADKLKTEPVDFVIVGQSLIKDISLLPKGKFILIAREPDRTYFLQAVEHGVRGYFLTSVAPELIVEAMNALPGHCYFDPALASWFTDLLNKSGESRSDDGALTSREREVLTLKRQHLSTREIAARLHISETSVKKHVNHIRRKLHLDDELAMKR